jgi:beta-glucosidase
MINVDNQIFISKVTQKGKTIMSNIEQHINELINTMTVREKVALLSGKNNWFTMDNERLGIPSLIITDGPHGVRTSEPETGRIVGPATSFPTGISMASSWNTELIQRVGVALAEETKAMGCHILLGPCVNIIRHPLAGRNFESFAEDPYLAGRIGVAYVEGVQSQNVGTSLKHFACNNQEVDRHRGSSVVDERTLREIYLAQFEMIVKEAKPWTVMCSYNRINGVYASENHHLLTEILKNEWGFDGVVVSDWGATHSIAPTKNAGLDLEMPGPAKYYGTLLAEAVQNIQVDIEMINESVRRILLMLYKAGQLDNPVKITPGSVNTPEHQGLALELAEESITLLKNRPGILPLDRNRLKSIAVIGPNAAKASIGGGGSSFLEPPYQVSPLEAIIAKVGNPVKINYEAGCQNFLEPPLIKAGYCMAAKTEQPGFWGEYYRNNDFSGKPSFEQLEKGINNWWFTSNISEGFSSRKFCARWSGKLQVPESGRYRFRVGHTGKCRLYLDGKQILESERTKGVESVFTIRKAVEMELESGRGYDFQMEYIKPEIETSAIVQLQFGHIWSNEEQDRRIDHAVKLAKESDIAVIFAGMPQGYESEGTDRRDIVLPGRQNELISAVAKGNPKTIVVLHSGSPVTMPWLDEVPAVLEAFYSGQEGGNAITSILFGEVNPSGKLAVTFPKRLEDTPAFINYPGKQEVFYGEGIFVGYRYYDKKELEPLFPFGFGLSYTTFEYDSIKAPEQAKIGEPVPVNVTITNTGKMAGKEVVQLYIHDLESVLVRPIKELKGFDKVFLKPGESKTIYFTLDKRAFSYYDPYQKQWVTEPGDFEILSGGSSRDIKVKALIKLL